MFLGKYNFNKDIGTHSNNSYYVDSDEEYYYEKCINLLLETIIKISRISFSKM